MESRKRQPRLKLEYKKIAQIVYLWIFRCRGEEVVSNLTRPIRIFQVVVSAAVIWSALSPNLPHFETFKLLLFYFNLETAP